MRSILLALGFLLASAFPLSAARNPFQVSDDLDAKIQAGLDELYNLNFDKAEAIFAGISDQAPEHPMVAFGAASVQWWRLSVYVLENDKKESQAFLDAADRAIKYSKAKIDKGDPSGEGYMVLGGTEGLLGRWKAANRDYMSAYFTGKSAYRNLRRALKTNAEMKDAYMGLGIFDYYVATLPSVVRVLAFLGQGGDAKVGLNELEIAATEGTYSRTPSMLFLVNIYSNLENKPEKALQDLSVLEGRYPKSPFIHMLKIIALYNHGPIDRLQAEADRFMQRVNDGTYEKRFTTEGLFTVGVAAFKQQRWSDADKAFSAAVRAGGEKEPFTTWAALYDGYALDAQGRRDKAVKRYETVASWPRRWGSQDRAQERLKTPFKPSDRELTKLLL